MPQVINLPGGQTATFPDQMPKDQIEAVLQKHFQQSQAQLPMETSPVIDRINAAGGGVAQGLVKTGAALGGLVTEAMPEPVRDVLRTGGRAVGEVLTPSPESIPGKAMKEYPGTALGGDIVGQVAPYAIPGTLVNKAGNYALSGLAGAASADDGLQNRLLGAGTGIAIQGGANVLGTLLQSGISALRSSGVVKNIVDYTSKQVNTINQTLKGSPREVGAQAAANMYNATRQADNEMFMTFRAASGNFSSEIRQVKRAAEDLLDELGSNLAGPQKQALISTIKKADSATSIADMHDVRKLLAANRQHFQIQAGEVASKAFGGLQKTVDLTMKDVAEKAGVLDEYLNANKHYTDKLLPLINAGTDDVSRALEEAARTKNPMLASQVLDRYIDKNIRSDAPNQTRAFLKTLDPIGRNAVEVRALERTIDKVKDMTNPGLAFRKEINKLNQTVGELFSEDNKKLVQGTMRVLDEAAPLLKNKLRTGEAMNMPFQLILSTVTKATDTATGQFILKMLGEPSLPRSIVKEFIVKGNSILGGSLQVSNPDEKN